MLDASPIYCAEQIKVPPQLAEILKDYTKEVIRRQPEDIVDFSAYYFSNLANTIPEHAEFDIPSIEQIAAMFKGLTASTSMRTCNVDAIRQEAVAVGISEATLTEVLRVANLSTASDLDPVEFCLLLVTTAADDVQSLVKALEGVFGEADTLDCELCRELFAILAKHNPRWGGSSIREEGLEGMGRQRLNAI